MREEKSLFEKRNQIRPAITLNFHQEVSSPLLVFMENLIWILPGWPEPTEKKIIRLCFRHTIFINFKVLYHKLKKYLNSRSSHQSCSMEKAVVKNFAIFTGKYLCWSFLLIDLRASRPATFLKYDTNTGIFLWIL